MARHRTDSLVVVFALLLALVSPSAARSQGNGVPWEVTLTPTVNPLPIGSCGAVRLTLEDRARKDHARNTAGSYVQTEHFDLEVDAGGKAIGQYHGANMFVVCACQGATIGASGTVIATYPAKGLDEKKKTKGVAFQAKAPFTIAKAVGGFNPQGCAPSTTTVTSTGTGTSGGTTVTSGSTTTTTTAPPVATGAPVATAPTTTPVELVAVTTMPLGTAQQGGAAPTAPTSAPPTTAPTGTMGGTLAQPVAVVGTPITRSPTAAPVTAPAAGPSPSGINITGTPASASLSWLTVLGATSYTVTRKQGTAVQATQTLAGSAKGMTDVGLRASTSYTYTLTAIQADGRAGSVSGGFVTPPAQNPTMFFASQLATGEVQLFWAPVLGATYYVVLGPGSSNGGVKVSGTSLLVTGAPAGPQTWLVGSYYDPGPTPATGVGQNAISTPASEFKQAQLDVAPPSTTAKWTSFKPSVNGFGFVNDFTNNFIPPPVGLTSSGLCGGMSYSVMDYFLTNDSIPTQAFRPANGTTLQMYFYGRQVTSLQQNLDRWVEATVNPLGSRTREFFNWGINERLAQIRSFVDRNRPVPLGMKGTDGGFGGDHQVLAIGYDMGRYKGDLGAYKQDVKIFILDPNFPRQIMTLVPDTAGLQFHYSQRPDKPIWRTYFVDDRYQPMTPPSIPTPSYANDGLVHELHLEFETGADDMRGGADHVDFKLKLVDGTVQTYQNISLGGRWLPNYTETAVVTLSTPVSVASMLNIQITTNATGGISGDNWDMKSVKFTAIGNGISRDLFGKALGPYRFVGGGLPFMVYLPK
ncbi:MAG: hypothetical protein JWL95_493 [Gemmatimonadetes bacterium]|nr:hypothetical protein [Gemmatimonadota bacterium]